MRMYCIYVHTTTVLYRCMEIEGDPVCDPGILVSTVTYLTWFMCQVGQRMFSRYFLQDIGWYCFDEFRQSKLSI